MRQATEGATAFEPIQVPSVTIRWPDAAAQSGESRRHIVLYGDGERGVLFGGDSACPRYAEIVSRKGEFFVVAKSDDELISVNGKLVHGEARLREHDVVRVGDNEIRFSLAEADEPGQLLLRLVDQRGILGVHVGDAEPEQRHRERFPVVVEHRHAALVLRVVEEVGSVGELVRVVGGVDLVDAVTDAGRVQGVRDRVLVARVVGRVAEARRLGMSVVVIDHHQSGDHLPEVNALVNRFEQAAKMMKTVAKGGVPQVPGVP